MNKPKKKRVVEKAPTVASLTAQLKEANSLIELLSASNESLRKSFNMLKENHEREKNRLDKLIDSHLNVTKCQK